MNPENNTNEPVGSDPFAPDNEQPQPNAVPVPPPQPAIPPIQPQQPPASAEPSNSTPSFATPQPTAPQQPSPAQKPLEYNSNPFIVAGKGVGAALTTNPVATFAIGFIPLLVIFVALLIPLLLAPLIGGLGAGILYVVGFIFALIVSIRAMAGSIVILLKSADEEHVTTKEAIGKLSSKKLTSFFFAILLMSIAISIGFILLIIPGVFLLGRMTLAPVIVYAEGLGAMAAIKRSMQLTKGHTFEVIGALTAQSFIASSGLLATVGGYSGTTRRYKELVAAEQAGNLKPTKTHWLNFVLPALMFIFVGIYVVLGVVAGTIDSNNSFNDAFIDNGLDTMDEDFEFNFDFDSEDWDDWEAEYSN